MRMTGRPQCPPYPAGTRFEVFEFWSSDMLKLFRQAGMPRRAPPAMPSCATEDPLDAPRIASPLRGVSYALVDRRRAKRSRWRRTSRLMCGVYSRRWQRPHWRQRVADGALAWRPTAASVHLVRIVDDHGRSAERQVEVQIGQSRIHCQVSAAANTEDRNRVRACSDTFAGRR